MKVKLLKKIRKKLNGSYRIMYYPYERIYQVEEHLSIIRYDDIWDVCQIFSNRDKAIEYYNNKLAELKSKIIKDYLSVKYKPMQIYP